MKTENKKLPQRHHYIPRFLLRNFSVDASRLFILDKLSPNPIRKILYHSVEAIGFENKLYTYRTDSGDKETLEDLFSPIEGEAKRVIDKLINGAEISTREKEVFSVFIALLKVRTPFERSESLKVDQALREKVYRLSVELTPREELRRIMSKGGYKLSNEELDETITFAKDEKKSRLKVNYPPEYWISMMLEKSVVFAEHFLYMDWEVRHADTKFAFIMNDNPLMMIPIRELEPSEGLGLLTSGVKKIVPLSGNTCLIMHEMSRDPEIHHVNTTKDFSIFVNEELLRHSFRFTYSSEKGKLEKLAKTHKHLLKPWEHLFSVE